MTTKKERLRAFMAEAGHVADADSHIETAELVMAFMAAMLREDEPYAVRDIQRFQDHSDLAVYFEEDGGG